MTEDMRGLVFASKFAGNNETALLFDTTIPIRYSSSRDPKNSVPDLVRAPTNAAVPHLQNRETVPASFRTSPTSTSLLSDFLANRCCLSRSTEFVELRRF